MEKSTRNPVNISGLSTSTQLFFYTGTGNSLWTARTLAEELGNTGMLPMSWNHGDRVATRADAVGILFPVHMWGLPHRVIARS